MKDKSFLLFDLGDTLLHSSHNIQSSWKDTLSYYDLEPSSFMSAYHSRYFLDEGAYCTSEKLQYIFKSLDWPARYIEDVLYDYRIRLRRRTLASVIDDPAKTWQGLQQLKQNYRLGILSDNSIYTKEQWSEILAFQKMADLFEFFITSEEVGEWKPHHKMFEAAIHKSGVAPSEIVYFGNDLRRDAAATKSGLDFVYVYGYENMKMETGYPEIEYINTRSSIQLGLA